MKTLKIFGIVCFLVMSTFFNFNYLTSISDNNVTLKSLAFTLDDAISEFVSAGIAVTVYGNNSVDYYNQYPSGTNNYNSGSTDGFNSSGESKRMNCSFSQVNSINKKDWDAMINAGGSFNFSMNPLKNNGSVNVSGGGSMGGETVNITSTYNGFEYICSGSGGNCYVKFCYYQGS